MTVPVDRPHIFDRVCTGRYLPFSVTRSSSRGLRGRLPQSVHCQLRRNRGIELNSTPEYEKDELSGASPKSASHRTCSANCRISGHQVTDYGQSLVSVLYVAGSDQCITNSGQISPLRCVRAVVCAAAIARYGSSVRL